MYSGEYIIIFSPSACVYKYRRAYTHIPTAHILYYSVRAFVVTEFPVTARKCEYRYTYIMDKINQIYYAWDLYIAEHNYIRPYKLTGVLFLVQV